MSLGSAGSPRGGAIPGASPIAASQSHVDIDEAEARLRAREILQDFVREKSKAVEVEGQLHRCLQENDKLQHTIIELKAEAAQESDRLKRLVENLKSEKLESETRAVNSREEAQKVTKAAAQRVSETASQLRLKEQEIEHLEAELTRARDEIRSLRKDLLLSRDSDNVTEDVSKVQYRVVELARKLLESEKAKTDLQKAVMEERKLLHQSHTTVDTLRNQLMEAERRSIENKTTHENDVQGYARQVEALTNEMNKQRELYEKFVQAVSKGDAGGKGSSDQNSSDSKTRVAVLETQLAALQQTNRTLQDQVESARAESAERGKIINEERTNRIEESSQLSNAIRLAEDRIAQAKLQYRDKEEQYRQLNERYVSQQALYEHATNDLLAKTNAVQDLAALLSQLQSQHSIIAEEMESLRNEVKVREHASTALHNALKDGAMLEQRMREQHLIHQHEKELLRLQFLRHGSSALLANNTSGNHSCSGDINGIELSPHMDMANLQHHVSVLEAEKVKWTAERNTAIHQFEGEKRLLQEEIRVTKKSLEDCQLEAAQLRAQALHCQREVEEWRMAFHSSERAKAKLEIQIHDVRESHTAQQKDKNTADLQVALLSQHVERLEAQAERDSSEIFRLRREVAMAEVALAKQKLNIHLDDIARVEKQDVSDQAAAVLKERELIQLRMGRQARERELQDKEIALQRLHESQLVDITKNKKKPTEPSPADAAK